MARKGGGSGRRESGDPKEILKRLRSARAAKVRYGRATLTVARSESVFMSPLADALKARRAGEGSDDDVAWLFIKERAIEHSPTFRWEDVDLAKLLPRVTAVARNPKIDAQLPAELVPELERIEKAEAEEWKKASKHLKQVMPGFSQTILKNIGLSNEIAKITRPAYLDAFEQIRSAQAQFAKTIRPNYLERIQEILRPLSKQFEESRGLQLKYADFGIAPKTYEDFVGSLFVDLDTRVAFGNQFFAQSEGWQALFQDVAAAARGADSPDIAEAVEATADEADKDPDDLNLEGLTKTLESLLREQKRLADQVTELTEQQAAGDQKLDELKAGSSASRQFVIGIAVNIVWALIQLYLAVKLGIYLPPPDDK